MTKLQVHCSRRKCGKNPREEEAWYYLALTAHEQGDHVRVAEACDSAELAGLTDQKTETVHQSEWVKCLECRYYGV